jgi:hypothetical protein
MTEGLCKRIHESARTTGRQFIWRSLLITCVLSATLSTGLAFLYLHSFNLNLGDKLELVGLFAAIGVLVGIVMVIMLKILIIRGIKSGLDRMDAVAGGGGHQVRRLAHRMEFGQLEERLIRALDERRDTYLGQERDRLLAASRYGWYMPDDQMEKISEDEFSAQLRGKTKECVQAFLVAPGASALLAENSSQDNESSQAQVSIKKYLARTQAFAKSAGMMLAVFSLDLSILVADVPFAGQKSARKKLPGLGKKWVTQCSALLAQAQAEEVVPACLLTFDQVDWSCIQSGSRSCFLAEAASVQSVLRCLRENSVSGLWLSAAFCEYAAMRSEDVPDLIERVPREWYSLD